MGLVYGPTGYGKTFRCCWLRSRCDGIYIRALAVWTPTDMLAAICGELGEPVGGRLAKMMDRIIDRLGDRPRSLMIDEADYIVDSKRMVESLRDLHDQSTAPVILIGMQGIEQRIRVRRQPTGRILQWVGFHYLQALGMEGWRNALRHRPGPDRPLRPDRAGPADGAARRPGRR